MITMRASAAAKCLNGTLLGRDIEFSGCSIDSRTVEQNNLFIALQGTRVDGHSFIHIARDRGACVAMVEKPMDSEALPLILIKDSKQAMGKLAGHWRNNFDMPLLAVTGSNGKTTVKEMIRTIMGLKVTVLATRGNLNNEIGVPLTLFGMGNEHQCAVIEMGANHPGEIARLSKMARPTVAVITQCAPAHLQGFGSVDGVARAKAEIFSGLDSNGIAVINADDNYADFWKESAADFRQITFGIKNKADVFATDVCFDPETCTTGFLLQTLETTVPVRLPLAGKHNVVNALAAAACCMATGMAVSDIRDGLEQVASVSGRMQMKYSRQGIRVFDDTYNANPVSLKAGLEVMSCYSGRKWLVLGDMGELGETAIEFHRQAGEMARDYGMERLYALGELSKHAVDGFGNGARHFEDSDELIDCINRDVAGDITMLIKGSRSMAMDRVVNSLVEGGEDAALVI